jgi:hypothetical protein
MNGDVLEKGRRRIRVLNGPLRGAAHLVHDRVGIGRASSSDIQLVHDGISRQHAQIVTDDRGRHVLVDLDSSNGTFIEGQRIRRHVLTPGTIFKIMRVKMIYEDASDELVELVELADAEPSEVFAVRRLDADTLRGTAEYGRLDLPQPATPRQRVAADTSPEAAAEAFGEHEGDAERDRPMARGGDASSAPAAQPRGEERHRVTASRRDGSVYEGSLVDDIVAYRELRVRIDRGDPIPAGQRQAFEALGRRLRAAPAEPIPAGAEPPGPPQVHREFERFQCNFPAKLRFASGDELAAAVLDLGVDGTRLRVYGHQIEHDAIVWLAIHLVSRGRAHTVVFTGRVAWTCRDHLGLGFAGAPGWENVGHRKVEVRTHMDLGEQLRAARATLGRLQARRPPG